MIGLLLLVFLIVLICSSWMLMRKVASLDVRWQYFIAAPLVCSILLVPIQFISRYSLASVWGMLVTVVVASYANVLLMFMLWHKNRNQFFVGLAVSLAFWAGNSLTLFVVVPSILLNASVTPVAERRISPIASYRIVQYPGFLGGATPSYTYETYENPRRFSFVWRKVADGTIPCGNGFDSDGVLIGTAANDHMVVVSCKKTESGFSPIQIPID